MKSLILPATSFATGVSPPTANIYAFLSIGRSSMFVDVVGVGVVV